MPNNPLGLNGRQDPDAAQQAKQEYHTLRRQGLSREDAVKQTRRRVPTPPRPAPKPDGRQRRG